MKTKYIKFCKRCNTETEHYACGSCIHCKLAYKKAYYQNHRMDKLFYQKSYYRDNRNERIAYQKDYQMLDLTNSGVSKHCIRTQSSYILFKKRNHTKLENYEIHHCFGYDDPNKFIYIPKALHLQIHQRLRDKNILAEDEHYEQIKDLINECQEYTYISI